MQFQYLRNPTDWLPTPLHLQRGAIPNLTKYIVISNINTIAGICAAANITLTANSTAATANITAGAQITTPQKSLYLLI